MGKGKEGKLKYRKKENGRRDDPVSLDGVLQYLFFFLFFSFIGLVATGTYNAFLTLSPSLSLALFAFIMVIIQEIFQSSLLPLISILPLFSISLLLFLPSFPLLVLISLPPSFHLLSNITLCLIKEDSCHANKRTAEITDRNHCQC